MARLSVEHFRANATMTPEQVRKSGRFRDIFKSRSSLSPSTNSSTTKLPQAADTESPPTSPTSPTVKPGFETVGLLPSERVSFADAKTELEKRGGTHVADVLEKQEKFSKGVGILHDVDTSLDAANVSRVDMAGKKAQEDERFEEANVIAEAFGDAIAMHSEEATVPAQDVPTEDDSSAQAPEEKPSPRVLRRSKLSISASDNPFAADLGEREPLVAIVLMLIST